MLGEVFALYPARSARAVGTRRTCDPGQPRRAAISTFQIEPPRKYAHFGTSHAPRKSLEAALGNAWSSLPPHVLRATSARGNWNPTCRSLHDRSVEFHMWNFTDSDMIDRHAFERFLIADCAQSATCNVYALEHNSGVPGVLSTNPARSSTSRMSARQLTGWLTPRAPV